MIEMLFVTDLDMAYLLQRTFSMVADRLSFMDTFVTLSYADILHDYL